MKRNLSVILFLSLVVFFAPGCLGADWPMWRFDANRSAATPQELPAELHLQWVREYPQLEPAWEDPVNQDRMPFDKVYEPIVSGSTMFIGSNRSDRVVAMNTRTGQEKWRIYVDGPVRFPPVAWKGKVYFTSDDGYLYCVKAKTGALIWRFRGGPGNRRTLGNSRLISAWPARGGPVIKDSTIYFAASIWPFMGTFIHALDAETGKVVWTNDGTGSIFMNQPHGGSVSFGGVAPQGSFTAIADKLIVPCGRSVPACLDRKTGELLYYHLSGSNYHQIDDEASRKREGGSHVSAIGEYYFNHRGLNTSMYDIETGEMYFMWNTTTYPVLADEVCYLSGNPVIAYNLKNLKKVSYEEQVKDRKTGKIKTVKKYRWEMAKLWECAVDGTGALIKAGNRLYAGGENVVSAIEVSKCGIPTVVWTEKIEGTAARIIAADNRLFVVTLQGRIYAFGADKRKPRTYKYTVTEAPLSSEMSNRAQKILKAAKTDNGYCLVFGLDTGELVEKLVKYSGLYVIAVDPDVEKVATLRRRFDTAGIYGSRVSVHHDDPMTFEAPPYIAALTTSENLKPAEFNKNKKLLEKVFYSMRPYGGVMCLPKGNASERIAFTELVKKSGLAGAEITLSDKYILLTRQGPLPDSGDWTHQYGNIANTAKSDDKLVKLPLGLLWFGGNTHHDILPRHAHGPPEQVIGGRLFIEGINMLSARDVYTGKVLWKKTFPDLGTFGIYYDGTYKENPLDTTYNQVHIPGANARGTNYVATVNKVYLVVGGDCLVLDSATGKTITKLSLPAPTNTRKKPTWGYVGVYEDLLIAGSDFVHFSKQYKTKTNKWNNFDTTSSRKLVVMDRHTGKVSWERDSKYGFRHNAIVVGEGKLFCIDSLPESVLKLLKRRGETPTGEAVLLCLDVRTGKPIWSKTENVFGTWLGYSKEHDILLQSGRRSRDMIEGEPTKRMIAYQGKDGAVLWNKPVEHGGPCMLHSDTIYLNAISTEGSAVSLLTGEKKMRRNPLTGEEMPWRYHRAYGCNSVVASEHFLSFRSGAAGYYDLEHNGGTGNIGGFKSGCTSNLIAANGVLNAPDYTRTCTCSYQNQTSLALIYMPEVEMWTFNKFDVEGRKSARIRQLGINFGAPGDRMAENETLWLDYPSVGGPSPHLQVALEPMNRSVQEDSKKKSVFAGRIFHHHSSLIKSDDLKWVVASGLIGVSSVTITLAEKAEDERPYIIRLYFAEPEQLKPGQRIFDVVIQNQKVLKKFDIAKEAGGENRCVVKEFKEVKAKDVLNIALTTAADSKNSPVLCGVEIIAEGW